MPSEPGYDFVIQVLAAADVVVQESHRLFRPRGLSGAQFNVLNVLGPKPEGLSQRELSDVLVVDRSNITGLLDRMTKAGWVRRQDHPSDRRVYLVSLTTSGRKLWRQILPDYLAAVRQVTGGLDRGELKRATETLQRLEIAARAWGRAQGE